jgi:hypothetical protein
MVSFSAGVLTKIVVPDMYKALSIHKIRQNTKMPTFYKTLYLDAWLVKSVPDFFIIKKSMKQFITDNASLLFCCCDIRIAIYFF